MCVCLCVCVCMCACIHVYVLYMCACMRTHVCISVDIFTEAQADPELLEDEAHSPPFPKSAQSECSVSGVLQGQPC